MLLMLLLYKSVFQRGQINIHREQGASCATSLMTWTTPAKLLTESATAVIMKGRHCKMLGAFHHDMFTINGTDTIQ